MHKKTRILLLAPIHREKENIKLNQGKYFPRFQAQSAWVDAFEALGNKVFVFIYTNSLIIPNDIRVHTRGMFEVISPLWTARFLRIKSRLYFLSIENFLRNKALLNLSHKTKPDIIIISGGISSIYVNTIKKIKDKYSCKVLLFSGVNPNIAATRIEKKLVEMDIVDVVIENDRGYAKSWEKMGAKKTIVLPISSVDPKLNKKVKLSKKERETYSSSICFVGTLTNDRQNKLLKLLNYDIKIWGDLPSGVEINNKLKPYYYGIAFGEKMTKIFNSAKIALNFQPHDMTHGGNMRTFEILGCGAFELADRVDPDFLKAGEEIELFDTIDELKKKINYFLKNDNLRTKIANTGFRSTHKDHTYEKHFKKLLLQI